MHERRGKHNGEHRLQAAGNHRPRTIKVFQLVDDALELTLTAWAGVKWSSPMTSTAFFSGLFCLATSPSDSRLGLCLQQPRLAQKEQSQSTKDLHLLSVA